MAEFDFFGYARQQAGSYIYSSDYAAVYFENSQGASPAATASRAGLVQNATCAYQHNVQPRFEGGSSELYWLAGQSMGTLQLGRLIGDSGILNNVVLGLGGEGADLRNGILGGVDFKIGRKGVGGSSNPATRALATQSILVLRGCVLSGYGASFSTGGLEVQEAMTIQVALMKSLQISSNGVTSPATAIASTPLTAAASTITGA